MARKLTRRDALKVLGTAGTVAIFSIGLQSAIGNNIKANPRLVPGAGRDGLLTKKQLDKIDADAFVSACARCGICTEVCPSSAIKFGAGNYPSLKEETLNKCMGATDCGLCIVNCPTNALSMAFKPCGIEVGVEGHLWVKGPKDDSKRTLSGNSGGG